MTTIYHAVRANEETEHTGELNWQIRMIAEHTAKNQQTGANLLMFTRPRIIRKGDFGPAGSMAVTTANWIELVGSHLKDTHDILVGEISVALNSTPKGGLLHFGDWASPYTLTSANARLVHDYLTGLWELGLKAKHMPCDIEGLLKPRSVLSPDVKVNRKSGVDVLVNDIVDSARVLFPGVEISNYQTIPDGTYPTGRAADIIQYSVEHDLDAIAPVIYRSKKPKKRHDPIEPGAPTLADQRLAWTIEKIKSGEKVHAWVEFNDHATINTLIEAGASCVVLWYPSKMWDNAKKGDTQ